MVELIFNVGNSTCYIGFVGDKKTYLLAVVNVVFAVVF